MPSSKVDFPVPFSPTMMVIDALEAQFEFVLQERQAERIGGRIGHARRIEPDPLQIRRRHLDWSMASRAHSACSEKAARQGGDPLRGDPTNIIGTFVSWKWDSGKLRQEPARQRYHATRWLRSLRQHHRIDLHHPELTEQLDAIAVQHRNVAATPDSDDAELSSATVQVPLAGPSTEKAPFADPLSSQCG